MKTIYTILLFLLSINFLSAQEYTKEKSEINNIIHQFRKSILKNDSTTFRSLFLQKSFNWVGVIKNKSQKRRLENNAATNPQNYFPKTYENFYYFILSKKRLEEIFENIHIINDDVIASVSFDYSFWSENKMTNWGKECWQLIKVDGTWKITSVLFSIELTKYFSKPKELN